MIYKPEHVSKLDMIAEVREFLEEKNYTDSTKVTYGYYLSDFSMYVAGLPLDCLDLHHVRDWLAARAWQGSSRYLAVCAVRAFVRWRFGEGHPVLKLAVRRPKSRVQRTLTLEQVQKLLLSIDTGRRSGLRNLALVCFLLDTSFRAAEACSLKLDRLDIERRTAWTIIKGGEWGEGVFGDYTAACLEAWLAARAPIARPGVKNVFVGCETGVGKPLTPAGLRSIFRKLGQKAGLGLISPHDMRRTFCTLALEGGAPTRIVQEAGRWQSLEMVELYSRAIRAHAIDPYSPVERAVKVGSLKK